MSLPYPFEPAEDGLPPGQVRFSELRVEPWPDQQRVRVHVTLTPFQQPPDLEAAIRNQDGQVVASVHIIETALSRMVFTMHVRSAETRGAYQLLAALNYRDLGTVDEKQVDFELHAPPPEAP